VQYCAGSVLDLSLGLAYVSVVAAEAVDAPAGA
jgi:hypothetical protein